MVHRFRHLMLLTLIAVLIGSGCASTKTFQGNPPPLKQWNQSLSKSYGDGWNGFISEYEDELKKIQDTYEPQITAAQAAIAKATADLQAPAGTFTKTQKALADAEAKLAAANKDVADSVGRVGADKVPRDLILKQAEALKNADDARKANEAAKKSLEDARLQLEIAKLQMKPYDTLLRNKRNEIIGELIVIAKAYHDIVDESLHYGRAGMNVMFDGTQLTATGLAAVTGSESTARILAMLATGSKGLQESVDKRFFYEHATAAILATMNTQRLKQEQVLIEKMALSIDEYPLQVAIDDWVTYLLAGELTDALREMSGTAAQKELVEIKALGELQTLSLENREALVKERAAREAAENELETLDQQIQIQVRKSILQQVSPATP